MEMPVLFVGHGSPMNAIEENAFTRALAGIASQYHGPRTIGFVAGILSSTAAIFWGWATSTGKLPEPPQLGVEPEDVEIPGEPTV